LTIMERIAYIRGQEAVYHEACYRQHTLFAPGSWLHKPVRTVLDGLELLRDRQELRMLDLGCGIGRNAIPLAESLIGRQGVVVCVDLLELALEQLVEYSKAYGVERYVKPCLCDIDNFEIEESRYDYSVAVSALEHVESVDIFEQKLDELARGTRPGGVVCLVVGSNIREFESESGRELDPLFEVKLATDQLLRLLDQAYDGWDVKRREVIPQTFNIERAGRAVTLHTDTVRFLAQKGSGTLDA